jgi:hypothetical protein
MAVLRGLVPTLPSNWGARGQGADDLSRSAFRVPSEINDLQTTKPSRVSVTHVSRCSATSALGNLTKCSVCRDAAAEVLFL